MFNKDILKDVVCPQGKKELELKDNFLICTNCGVKFPIVDDIPVLIIEEALLPEGINSVNELPCKKSL